MTENRMQYHFYIVCENVVYFYNQREITTYIPDFTWDFVLLADYVQPAWVKKAVFYQIFPERFCNGNPTNDVKSGEYMQNGHPAIHMNSWEDTPLTYKEGFCLDLPSVHKYDCVDYFHVDPHFGGDEALAELSKELHENGMKLILDISINHTGTDHKWFILTNVKIFQFTHSTWRIIGQHALCGKENLIVSEYS